MEQEISEDSKARTEIAILKWLEDVGFIKDHFHYIKHCAVGPEPIKPKDEDADFYKTPAFFFFGHFRPLADMRNTYNESICGLATFVAEACCDHNQNNYLPDIRYFAYALLGIPDVNVYRFLAIDQTHPLYGRNGIMYIPFDIDNKYPHCQVAYHPMIVMGRCMAARHIGERFGWDFAKTIIKTHPEVYEIMLECVSMHGLHQLDITPKKFFNICKLRIEIKEGHGDGELFEPMSYHMTIYYDWLAMLEHRQSFIEKIQELKLEDTFLNDQIINPIWLRVKNYIPKFSSAPGIIREHDYLNRNLSIARMHLRQYYREERIEFPPHYFEPLEDDKALGITYINNSYDLDDEGFEMHHCAGSLIEKCKDGRSYIFKYDDGEFRGTFEVDSKANLVQFRGKANCDPPESTYNKLSNWVSRHERFRWPNGKPPGWDKFIEEERIRKANRTAEEIAKKDAEYAAFVESFVRNTHEITERFKREREAANGEEQKVLSESVH